MIYIFLLLSLASIKAQNSTEDDTEVITPKDLNLPDFLNDPENELFNPNYNPLIKLKVLKVNRTDQVNYEMNMKEQLKLFSVTNKTEAISLNIKVVKQDNLSDQVCFAVQQSLNFKLNNELNLTSSVDTVIPPPTQKNDYDILLKQLVVGKANTYQNYILDFTRVNLNQYYAATFDRKLYFISSTKDGLKIDKDYDLSTLYAIGNNTDLFLIYHDPVLYLFDGPNVYFLKDSKFTKILIWEAKNINKIVSSKDHLIVSERTKLSVYQVTSDFDLKNLNELSYFNMDIKDMQIKGENKTDLVIDKLNIIGQIVLDSSKGFFFYKMDFTNPYSQFQQKFNIPIVDGFSFDESSSKILIVVIKKKLYSYAVEFMYDVKAQQANITNLYWNDGIVNKVYILEEFAILTGDNSHQVIVHFLQNHLQQDKEMTKESFAIQKKQDLSNAFLYYQQLQDLHFLKKEMILEKVKQMDGPATDDINDHKHLKEQLEVPVIIAIGRNKISQFIIDKEPPYIQCYAEGKQMENKEFKYLVYQNFTDCPEKQEYETLKNDTKVICQYETILNVETYTSELTNKEAVYIIIIVVVLCVVVLGIIITICCIRSRYKKKEDELDNKISLYQQQKDVKDFKQQNDDQPDEKQHFDIE